MKKRSILIILSVLALSACASAPVSKAPMEIDSEYVNAVERHAKNAGVEVQWVNPPQRKRAAATDDQG